MKELTARAKSIRKAARLREKYSEDDDFIDDGSTEALNPEEEEFELEVPIKITARHTVDNVMDLIKEKERKKSDIITTGRKLSTTKELATGIELPAIDPANVMKFNEFLARKENNKDDIESQKPVSSHGDHILSDDNDEADETNPNDIIPSIMYNWIGSIVENLNLTTNTTEGESNVDENPSESRIRAGTLDKLDHMMYTHQIKFKILEFFMESLENIVGSPIVYLCKGLDPIALNLALDYVATNELTNNIIVVHIVDDRQVIKSHTKILSRLMDLGMDKHLLDKYHSKLVVQHITGTFKEKMNDLQKKKTALSVADVYAIDYKLDTILANLTEEIRALPVLVSLFDTLYMFVTFLILPFSFFFVFAFLFVLFVFVLLYYIQRAKRLSCLIVRGTTFSPSSVKWVSDYLNVPLTNFIMGKKFFIFEC